MKIIKRTLFAFILTFIFVASVSAKYTNLEGVGFNYGGDKRDLFYDIDFFSDGSYVVVGESTSTFGTIVNNGSYSDGIITIYDKNNNLVKEGYWNNDATNQVEALYAVKVIDDNSFVTCGHDGVATSHCIKYDKNLNVVWNRSLTNASSNIGDQRYAIYLEDDGNMLVAPGSLNSRIFRLSSSGEILSTIKLSENVWKDIDVTEIVKYKDYYVLSGDTNVTGSTALTKLSKEGQILDTHIFATDTSSIINDVDVLNDDLLVSTKLGVCDGNCNNPLGDSSDGLFHSTSSIAIIDENYNVKKEYTIDVVAASSIRSYVLDNNIIATIVDVASGAKSYIYYFDTDLNLLGSFKYQVDGLFDFFRGSINPTNNYLYIAGALNKTYGNISNNGNLDGIVLSMYPKYVEDAPIVDPDPTTDPDSTPDSIPSNPTEDNNKPATTEEKEEVKEYKNPETGMFLNISLVIIAIAASLIVIKVVRSKRIFYKM